MVNKRFSAKWPGDVACVTNVEELSHYMRWLRFVAYYRLKKTFVLVVVRYQHMLEGAWSLHISFQNYSTQEGTGKVIYKPSILDKEQLHVKQDRSRSHKSDI